MAKLTPKKKTLSEYSTMLGLNIDEFTGTIKSEVDRTLNVRAAVERNDKTSVERALLSCHGLITHLITEHRRVKSRYLVAKQAFDKVEQNALAWARDELSSKATVNEVKNLAYQQNGETLHDSRRVYELLEQQYKTLQDHVDAARSALSAMQTWLRSMGVEMESSKA